MQMKLVLKAGVFRSLNSPAHDLFLRVPVLTTPKIPQCSSVSEALFLIQSFVNIL